MACCACLLGRLIDGTDSAPAQKQMLAGAVRQIRGCEKGDPKGTEGVFCLRRYARARTCQTGQTFGPLRVVDFQGLFLRALLAPRSKNQVVAAPLLRKIPWKPLRRVVWCWRCVMPLSRSSRARKVLASPTRCPDCSAQVFQLVNSACWPSHAFASSSQHSSHHAKNASCASR